MGFEADQFVNPEHISPELLCPICCGVLEKPVQTATEHLFCEDELLEWLERSDMCPVTNTRIDPTQIRKPSRIVMNILGGLVIKCSNRTDGCAWTGKYEILSAHLAQCEFKPRKLFISELEEKTKELAEAKALIKTLKSRVSELESSNTTLQERNIILERQLKVYDAFVKDESNSTINARDRQPTQERESKSSYESDLQRINRLRLLESKIPQSGSK